MVSFIAGVICNDPTDLPHIVKENTGCPDEAMLALFFGNASGISNSHRDAKSNPVSPIQLLFISVPSNTDAIYNSMTCIMTLLGHVQQDYHVLIA